MRCIQQKETYYHFGHTAFASSQKKQKNQKPLFTFHAHKNLVTFYALYFCEIFLNWKQV